MKYKCIAKYFVEDSLIMKPGDIIVMNEDKLYNITTGVDYRNIPDISNLKMYLESITDEISSPQPLPVITDVNRFEDITNKMIRIFKKKNHDYGNSFEQSLNEEGLAASRIRMGDKWNRFKTLSKPKTEAKVNDESLRDTLIDLGVYCILTIMWLDKNGENKKSN